MKQFPSVRPLVIALLACGSAGSHAVSFTHNDITLDINGTVNGYYVYRNAESIDWATGAVILMLVRTANTPDKRNGLSVLIVPNDLPGMTIRPFRRWPAAPS